MRVPARSWQHSRRTHPGASIAFATLLVVGLAGCAAGVREGPVSPVAEGVFTGEYVDGKPLYRFPSSVVIGSRSSSM